MTSIRSYVALTEDASTWLVDRGVELIGIDYLSVQRFEDSPETHRILMRAGITIIEGLDLTNAAAGESMTGLPAAAPVAGRGCSGAGDPHRAQRRHMAQRIVALVPMRHSSERVPGKNYRPLGGRPLFHHIVSTLLACPAIDQIVIDTDSERDPREVLPTHSPTSCHRAAGAPAGRHGADERCAPP